MRRQKGAVHIPYAARGWTKGHQLLAKHKVRQIFGSDAPGPPSHEERAGMEVFFHFSTKNVLFLLLKENHATAFLTVSSKGIQKLQHREAEAI